MKTSDILAGGIYATAESNPLLLVVLSTDLFEQSSSQFSGPGAVRRSTPGQPRYSGSRYGVLVAETISFVLRFDTPAEEAAALTEFAAAADVSGTDVWRRYEQARDAAETAAGTEPFFTLADGRRAGFRIRVMTPQQVGMTLADHEESVAAATRATLTRLAERDAIRAGLSAQLDEIKTLLGVDPGAGTTFGTSGVNRVTVDAAELLTLVRKLAAA